MCIAQLLIVSCYITSIRVCVCVCVCGGLLHPHGHTHPGGVPTLITNPWMSTPKGTWYQKFTPEKTWDQRYPSISCEQTHTCENITLPHLSLRAVNKSGCLCTKDVFPESPVISPVRADDASLFTL